MKKYLVFLFILLAISERFLTFEIGSLNIGLFDISIILISIYILLNKIRIPKFYLIFIIYFIISNIYIFFFVNNNISLTSIATVPLKFILIIYLAKHTVDSKLYSQICLLLFIFLLVGLFTISDGSNLFDIQLLNRNETIAYLLAIIYLIPNSYKKLRINLLVILILASFFVQSRQIVVGLIFSLIIFFFLNFRKFIRYLPLIFIIAFSSIYYFNNIYFSNLDEYNKRRYEFSSIESRTRADRIRFFNLIWGLENSSKSPIIGQGTGSYVRLNPLDKVAHNSYLTTYFENGIIGLTLFFFLLYYAKPKKEDVLSNFIFFIMIGQILFIESIGKFFIYLYLMKSQIKRDNLIKN